MGAAASHSLAVWMNGERVGLWLAQPSRPQVFRYDDTWLESGLRRDLLSAIGRDCVGAIQLLPADQPYPEMKKIQAKRLDVAGVARAISPPASQMRWQTRSLPGFGSK